MDKKPTSKLSKSATSSNKVASKINPKKLTQEQIALHAYFISEKRQKTGRSGDHLSDWIEAERELMSETE